MSKPIAIVTGCGGLVGSAMATRLIEQEGYRVIGVDNDKRGSFFGAEASVANTLADMNRRYSSDQYQLIFTDLQKFTDRWSDYVPSAPDVVVHCAAQPSHDYAVQNPSEDWRVNASCTRELLETTRLKSPEAVFVFMSTNKVYGDRINSEQFVTAGKRWDLPQRHLLYDGVPESFSIDQTKHSLFGASKLAADVMAQEYGHYFGMNVGVFRGGCLSGARHAGVPLHGFLSYLVRCALRGKTYKIIGYEGKQVRDNIDSVDLCDALMSYINDPDPGAVYNIGGGRANSVSILEAIELIEEEAGVTVQSDYDPTPRIGDHQWWITDLSKFERRYPDWSIQTPVRQVIRNIIDWERSNQKGNGNGGH